MKIRLRKKTPVSALVASNKSQVFAGSRCHYRVLGLTPSAPENAIKAAYKRAALSFHPDRPGGDAAAFQDALAAWLVLGCGLPAVAVTLPVTTHPPLRSAAVSIDVLGPACPKTAFCFWVCFAYSDRHDRIREAVSPSNVGYTTVYQSWPQRPPSGDQQVFKLRPQQRALLGPDAPDQQVSKLRPSTVFAGARVDQQVSKLRPEGIVPWGPL